MQTQQKTILSINNLKLLPAFAQYILTHRLREYVEYQVGLSKELNIPLLKAFDHLSNEQLLEVSIETSKEFLNFLAKNKAQQQIDESLVKWIKNKLPVIDQRDIIAEDITLLTYVRKQSFLQFITEYCRDTEQIIELIREIDLFLTRSETEATNTYIDLLRRKLEEHSHFIEKITNTSPGIIYVYDVVRKRDVYANKSVTEFLGYTQEEMLAMGPKLVSLLIHPEDQKELEEYENAFTDAKDGEIRSHKYRMKNRNGEYRWLRTYETVFKRDEKGKIVEKIGIAIDIHQQRIMAEQLKERESQLKEAQALAQIGSWTWDTAKNELIWSDELYKIYELEPGTPIEFEKVSKYNHPDDLQLVAEAMKQSMETLQPHSFYYRIILPDGRQKTLHAKGQPTSNANGECCKVFGTLQDVTERQTLIEKLQYSESLYKQTEELVNIGNWKWNLKTNEIEWTDQQYRIYGLQPQSEKISFERFMQFVHPDYKEVVDSVGKNIYRDHYSDHRFKIIAADGKIRTLHTIAKLHVDKEGAPSHIVGAEQDITTEEAMLQKLQKTETLYRQAEELANMGNWSWDVKTNKIEWTDQLYKIYGLEPQSEQITIERFLSFVHPDDKASVKNGVTDIFKQNIIDYTFRIITKDGQTKILRSVAQVQTDKEGKPISIVGAERDVTEKQTLIEKLKESQKLYEQAQSLAHLGNWTWKIAENKIEWSNEVYRIYGLEPGSPVDFDTYQSLLHPDDREQMLEVVQNSLKTNQPYEVYHKILRKDGTERIAHARGEVITGKDGKPVQLLGTAQDVTEQQRVQHELKENQTFIRKITDATPSIITSYNINTGKYVFISEGLQKLLGYGVEPALKDGINFFINIVHPDDLQSIMEKNQKVLEEANADPSNDLVAEFTYRMRRKDGEYRWFHTYGTVFDRNNNGKVEHILNISLDITEQVQASETIKEQEHFIQQIADASPTILYLYDVEKQSFAYINREMFFVLGYTPEEIIEAGDSVTELLYHPEEYHLLPERKQSKKKFEQTDLMIQYECRMRLKDADWRWVLVREIVFKTDDAGNVTQILGAALDINRRKEMEKTILRNSFQLEQSNASLQEFAYVASHDLKEPLRKISTFGDRLMATQQNFTPEGSIYLKKIIDASQRMQTMINDLLSISMISGDRSFRAYSLQQILDETLQTLEYKIEQKNAAIKSDPLPEAKIVPSQFRQLFQNLLSNSLKFLREDVQPQIIIKHTYIGPEEVGDFQLPKSGKYHKIDFKDNGIGFENEYAGKIFTIFQRLHGRSEYEGTGIGLAICKKIVEHHGGIIYANGVPDEGAVFTIILPV